MVVATKKREESKVILMVSSRFFLVSPKSFSRVCHAKCIFIMGSLTDQLLVIKAVSNFTKVCKTKESLRIIFPGNIIFLRYWNNEAFLGGLSPLGVGTRVALRASPKVAYQWALNYPHTTNCIRGGILVNNLTWVNRQSFDSFRFYSSLLILIGLSYAIRNSSYKGHKALYLGNYLSKKKVYSHLLNYVVGILGQRKLFGYAFITQKGRIVAWSLSIFLRKKVDSFW